MKNITVQFSLSEAEWEVLKERAEQSYPETKAELKELGQDYSLEDAIATELMCIVSSDIENYDIYDKVRYDAQVQSTIRSAIKREMERKNG